jgi:hypothetical protein
MGWSRPKTHAWMNMIYLSSMGFGVSRVFCPHVFFIGGLQPTDQDEHFLHNYGPLKQAQPQKKNDNP